MIGLGTIERLTDAAARGCDVCLMYDYVGSMRLRNRHLAPTARAGGRLAAFNRWWPPWKRNGPLRIRNHRMPTRALHWAADRLVDVV